MPKTSRSTSPSSSVQYVNPDNMVKNPAFTQAVVVGGSVKTIYIGAQTPVDGSGSLVGKGDMAAQTEQVLKNIEMCLAAAGARPEHLIRWNIYLVRGQPAQGAFEAGMRWWGGRPNPPANTVLTVDAFWLMPDVLVSIDAIAVVPA